MDIICPNNAGACTLFACVLTLSAVLFGVREAVSANWHAVRVKLAGLHPRSGRMVGDLADMVCSESGWKDILPSLILLVMISLRIVFRWYLVDHNRPLLNLWDCAILLGILLLALFLWISGRERTYSQRFADSLQTLAIPPVPGPNSVPVQ